MEQITKDNIDHAASTALAAILNKARQMGRASGISQEQDELLEAAIGYTLEDGYDLGLVNGIKLVMRTEALTKEAKK